MAIIKQDNIYILETAHTHYVLGVDAYGYNRHIHWGKKCSPADYEVVPVEDENSNHTACDEMHQEYTVFGGTMYRPSALKVTFADGCREVEPAFERGEIDGDTLRLCFKDRIYPLQIVLHYRVYAQDDVIMRFVQLKNTGDRPIQVHAAASAEFTLPSHEAYRFCNTNGAWGGENRRVDTRLDGGELTFESRKGISGHTVSPYFIAHQGAAEESGAVFGAALAYSGNFKVQASRDLYGVTRVLLGINDFDFRYDLLPGACFDTPQVFFAYAQGFGGFSRTMHGFMLRHILPKRFAGETLPVLYNSWEATGFDVSSAGQAKLAEIAAGLGVELFVMDDGWFGARNSDRAGLGDWFVNPQKFPNGLDELIEKVNALGMDFGIWVEPEMVNKDSDLFRAHPDWTYHYETRRADELRNQLVLNMTRSDVQAYVFDCLDRLLSEHNIRYIKWDMNRPFSQTGAENLACPQSLWYLHTQAVYSIVDRLRAKHPDVQFESCASGGGRDDWGALMHFDEVWPSDNTDAVDRLQIQQGYSLLNPAKTMRAWVTDISPVGRPVSLDFRFVVAMQGALSLGGNLLEYDKAMLETCKKYIALYKQIRPLVQFGDLYRLRDARSGTSFNQYVSANRRESAAFLAAPYCGFYRKQEPLVFAGLDAETVYTFELFGKAYEKSGAYLMHAGVPVRLRGDCICAVIHLRAKGDA